MSALSVERGVTGAAIFRARSYRWHGFERLYWNGPGARLRYMFGDALISIEHPSADGSYATFLEARKAAIAFFAELEK